MFNKALMESLESRVLLSSYTPSSPEVIASFGEIPGVGVIKTVELQDSGGNLVKFSLSGGGYGMVVDEGGVWKLFLEDTEAKSSLKIATKTQAVLGGIESDGPLKSINAPKVNIQDGDIVIANAHLASAMKISLGILTDVNLTCPNGYISSLKVVEWRDTALSDSETITASAVKTFHVKGNKSALINGDLLADINLTNGGLSLGNLKVSGKVSSDLYAAGGIKSIYFGAWNSGDIEADWIGTITGKANLAAGNSGAIMGGIYLSGQNAPKAVAVKKINAAGIFNDIIVKDGIIKSISTSTLQNCNLEADAIANITVTAKAPHLSFNGSVNNILVDIKGLADPQAAGLKKVKVQNYVQSAVFYVMGDLKSFTAGAILDSDIYISGTSDLTYTRDDFYRANELKKLTVKGMLVDNVFTYFTEAIISAWEVGSIKTYKTPGVEDVYIQCVDYCRVPDTVSVTMI